MSAQEAMGDSAFVEIPCVLRFEFDGVVKVGE